MDSSRSALFVIDIQNDMARCAQTQIPHTARIVEAGHKIVAAARSLDEKPLIVFVQHEEGPEEGLLVRGSEPWKLVFDPQPSSKNEILVAKTTSKWVPGYSTFFGNPE